VSDSCCQTLK